MISLEEENSVNSNQDSANEQSDEEEESGDSGEFYDVLEVLDGKAISRVPVHSHCEDNHELTADVSLTCSATVAIFSKLTPFPMNSSCCTMSKPTASAPICSPRSSMNLSRPLD